MRILEIVDAGNIRTEPEGEFLTPFSRLKFVLSVTGTCSVHESRIGHTKVETLVEHICFVNVLRDRRLLG